MLDTLNLAIVDVETTGASAAYDRVIEIGIARIEQGQLVHRYSSLIDPECRIPREIQQLTGITEHDVEGAPTFRQVADEIRRALDGCIFVAHNVRFDYGFLRNEFQRLDHAFEAPCLCTVRLSRLLYPNERQHSLSALIERFGLSCARRHRALDDAEATWEFIQKVRDAFDPTQLGAAIQVLLRRPTLPPQLPPDTIDNLPHSPGVYVFYDATGMPIYVGKSVDIRERVMSHFCSDYRSGRGMRICQSTARIETHLTYGELGALLLESHLIKTLAPLHNRLSRVRRRLVAICQAAPHGDYDSVAIEILDAAALEAPDRILGIFRSRKQAKDFLHDAAREHHLCPRLLGLERASGTCFYRQIGQCRGACDGSEPAGLYNARLAGVFASRRIKTWPYPGPVVLEERARDRNQGHLFLLDQWRLIRAMAYNDEGMSTFLDVPASFDYDSYQILVRHLLARGAKVRRITAAQAKQLMGEGQDGADADSQMVGSGSDE